MIPLLCEAVIAMGLRCRKVSERVVSVMIMSFLFLCLHYKAMHALYLCCVRKGNITTVYVGAGLLQRETVTTIARIVLSTANVNTRRCHKVGTLLFPNLQNIIIATIFRNVHISLPCQGSP